MRKQIAAANWKMNLTLDQGKQLLSDIMQVNVSTEANHQVIFAVPYPYLTMAQTDTAARTDYAVAAQNCYSKKAGAYTGEVSAEMLYSIGIKYCVVGHSERREYFHETDEVLAEKINILLAQEMIPLFCCGEPLAIRQTAGQNAYVESQLQKSLFHLTPGQVVKIIIAYEPIWAIGTGQTATTEQAQEMHAHIRSVLAKQYGQEVAESISILYGGSVKGSNAAELFSCADVDGGLVGGASLVVQDFIQIIKALK